MVLYPNADFGKVSEISIEFLKENDIRALILDVDNTLIDYYKNLSQETRRLDTRNEAKWYKIIYFIKYQ